MNRETGVSSWRIRTALARCALWIWRFREEAVWRAIVGRLPERSVASRRFGKSLLYVEVDRSSTHWRLWCRGRKHVPELGILESLEGDLRCVLDVGANIGYVALEMAQHVGSRGKVVCFEPDTDNLRELARNRDNNGLTRIEIIPEAVGSRSGRVSFRPGLNGTVDQSGAGEVTMIRLDDLALESVDLIKIDVEGFEGEVLAGATATIDSQRPVLLVEVHRVLAEGWTHRDLVGWIAARYTRIEAFEIERARSVASKVVGRYFRGERAVRIDLEEALHSFEAGDRNEVMWLLASSGRSHRGADRG